MENKLQQTKSITGEYNSSYSQQRTEDTMLSQIISLTLSINSYIFIINNTVPLK